DRLAGAAGHDDADAIGVLQLGQSVVESGLLVGAEFGHRLPFVVMFCLLRVTLQPVIDGRRVPKISRVTSGDTWVHLSTPGYTANRRHVVKITHVGGSPWSATASRTPCSAPRSRGARSVFQPARGPPARCSTASPLPSASTGHHRVVWRGQCPARYVLGHRRGASVAVP